MIRNRAVDPKKPRARPAFKKIFVGGIDADMPKEEIKNYFERFGAVRCDWNEWLDIVINSLLLCCLGGRN